MTDARGVDVALESVGGEAGVAAFGTLAPLGCMVMFGAASGQLMPPPSLMQMNVEGLTLSGFGGPWLRPGRAGAARAAISVHLRNGDLRPVLGRSFALADAPEAHRALEERSTTGKVLLTV